MRKIRRFDAFVLFSVICCSPFPLTAQRSTHDVIVLNEGDVSPILEELYLKFSCFSNNYEVSITNHALKNSTINVIKRNNNNIILTTTNCIFSVHQNIYIHVCIMYLHVKQNKDKKKSM